jgi:NAD(P)-dependent dehydrogenase (short-subunit alcohol dehydrogenase family)
MGVLDGKIAIVTGASSGIGRATASLFAREGARLVVTARDRSGLDVLVAEVEAAGGEAVAVDGDVSDESVARELVEISLERFGGLDVAFNNAGINGTLGSVTDLSLADWRETLDTNLTSAFLGAKHQVPALVERGGGSIVFTSSFVGHSVGFPGMAAYAASKAAIVGLQVLAVELGQTRVRVNAILPGGTDTPSNAANLPGADPETRGFIEGLHALRRMASPEEIARSVLHLASDLELHHRHCAARRRRSLGHSDVEIGNRGR